MNPEGKDGGKGRDGSEGSIRETTERTGTPLRSMVVKENQLFAEETGGRFLPGVELKTAQSCRWNCPIKFDLIVIQGMPMPN